MGYFDDLNTKQQRAAERVLGGLGKYDHIQTKISKVDGYGFVQAFLCGRRVREITLGPRGGVKRDQVSQY